MQQQIQPTIGAHEEMIVAEVIKSLKVSLHRLDRLKLWQAGAHLDMAIHCLASGILGEPGAKSDSSR